MTRFAWPLLALAVVVVMPLATAAGAGEVEVTILQLNDVYEITPLNRDAVAGLARVATLRKELEKKNPGRVITVLAGDFLSPSALGNAVVGGRPLEGRQMVAVLNAMGVDYVTFGNHEFDYKAAGPLLRAIRESNFLWLGTNVSLNSKDYEFPERKVVPTWVHKIRVDDRAEPLKVGLLGVTFYPADLDPSMPPDIGDLSFPAPEGVATKKADPPFATFRPPIASAKAAAGKLLNEEGADVVIALTHLNLERERGEGGGPFKAPDLELADEVREIQLIIGGHEHANNFRIDFAHRDRTPIFKADANARTAYVHHIRLSYDATSPGRRAEIDRIDSELRSINLATDQDPYTAAVADGLFRAGIEALREQLGADPLAPIGLLTHSLDGRDDEVRVGPTNLTSLIARVMGDAAKRARPVDPPRYAIFNSGTIRIDDVLSSGPITTYDVIRILPYGGTIYSAEMEASAFREFVRQTTGSDMHKKGGFLQAFDLEGKAGPDGLIPVIKPDSDELKAAEKVRFVFNDYLINPKSIDPNLVRPIGDEAMKALGLTPVARPGENPSFAAVGKLDLDELKRHPIGGLRDALIAHFKTGPQPPKSAVVGLADGRAVPTIVNPVSPAPTPTPAPAGPATSSASVDGQPTNTNTITIHNGAPNVTGARHHVAEPTAGETNGGPPPKSREGGEENVMLRLLTSLFDEAVALGALLLAAYMARLRNQWLAFLKPLRRRVGEMMATAATQPPASTAPAEPGPSGGSIEDVARKIEEARQDFREALGDLSERSGSPRLSRDDRRRSNLRRVARDESTGDAIRAAWKLISEAVAEHSVEGTDLERDFENLEDAYELVQRGHYPIPSLHQTYRYIDLALGFIDRLEGSTQ